ncbi:hypothetical protein A9255_20450 [Xenorhabdus hominickii]|uniref:Uncharacterized protein n=1 Tax=Xenorhabdus hominickii TaxID=351679 RepID=A0A2G0Q0C0_XENHO|nr:hypothetical protein A9255_20450 [Xenorhabdus hominickii]PHM52646.1 hypothetical protein Xhom_04314 [Xenorhabdus hominickii]
MRPQIQNQQRYSPVPRDVSLPNTAPLRLRNTPSPIELEHFMTHFEESVKGYKKTRLCPLIK